MNANRFKTLFLNLLLALVIIFAPSNLFLKLCDGCGYVNGLQSDYLLPKLYLVDLLLVGVIGWGVITGLVTLPSLQKWSQQAWVRVALLLALGLRQVWAPFPLVALWNFGQLLLLASSAYTILQAGQKKVLSLSAVAVGLTLSLLLQTSVSIYQYVNQEPLFAYHILGETNLSQVTGIATFDTVRGEIRTSPYGTTAHPNILAGFISVYSFLLARGLVEHKTNKMVALATSFTIGGSWIVLALTQSFSGAAMLASGGLILALNQVKWLHYKSFDWWQKFLVFLIALIFFVGLVTTWIPTNEKLRYSSVNRRQYLLETSWQMASGNWLWGSGLSNFTALAEQYSSTTEIVRFNQPVHHVGWLWVTETGLFGICLVISLLTLITNNKQLPPVGHMLIFFLPSLVWDHYLLSLESGRILILLFSVGSFFFLYRATLQSDARR